MMRLMITIVDEDMNEHAHMLQLVILAVILVSVSSQDVGVYCIQHHSVVLGMLCTSGATRLVMWVDVGGVGGG